MTLKVGSEVSTNGEGMTSLPGIGRVYERGAVGVTGVIGGLIGDTRRSVEPPSEASEIRGVSASVAMGAASNLALAQNDWANSSPEEARRRIGGRIFEKEESRSSWGALFSEKEKRFLWWAFEVVVDTEEMDEAGEGGRGTS